MRKLVYCIIVGFLGFYLATILIPGVSVEGDFANTIKVLFFASIVLGMVNYFIKPLLKIITIPLRIITFGLFGLVINTAIIWFIDILFPELIIVGLSGLFWTGAIVWFLSLFIPKNKKHHI
jgi:putative membrane protein